MSNHPKLIISAKRHLQAGGSIRMPTKPPIHYGCSHEHLDFYNLLRAKQNDIELFADSSLVIGTLFNIDGWSSTLAQDVGSIGHLPTGQSFRFHNYNLVPYSLVRKSFYDTHIAEKMLPWTSHTFLKFDSRSLLSFEADAPFRVHTPFGMEMDFSRLTKVHGLGLLPFSFGGIPLLAQVLVVDDIFPNQPPFVNASRFDVIFNDKLFQDLHETMPTVYKHYDWMRKIFVLERELGTKPSVTIRTLQVTNSNNSTGSQTQASRVLHVWIDGCCLNNHSPSVPNKSTKGGVGIFYAQNSLFNTALSLTSLESSCSSYPATNQRAEVHAAIKSLKQILTLYYSHGYVFDTALVLSDSEYLVKGMAERIHTWKAQGWRNAAGRLVANKDLWLKLDELVSNYFNLESVSTPDASTESGTKLGLKFIWLPREQNLEADSLAKSGALLSPSDRPTASFADGSHFFNDLQFGLCGEEGVPSDPTTASSINGTLLKLDETDGSHFLNDLQLGVCDEQSEPKVVKVVEGGLTTKGVPAGFGLKGKFKEITL